MTAEYSGGGDPRRSMELLWGTKARPRRGPRPRFTVAEVARVAIEIADQEGLAALSMRRVADRLGVTAMSLYTYVPGKAELLDLMLDTVYGEVLGPAAGGADGAARPGEAAGDGPGAAAAAKDGAAGGEPANAPGDAPGETPGDAAGGGSTETGGGAPGDWRARLERVARRNWELYRRHPWLLQVATSRPVLGPNLIAKYDDELRAVAGLGLTEIEMDLLVTFVSDYVHGAARTAVEAVQVKQRTGMTDEQWWASYAPLLEQVFDADRYPVAARVGGVAGAEYGAAQDPARAFEFGLRRVLDGIESLVAAAAARRDGTP